MINLKSSHRYKVNRKDIRAKAADYLLALGLPGETGLNIVFVGKTKMKGIATVYKKEAVALPVLSFAYQEKIEDENLLGEVIVCYPQAVLLAAERNKRVDDLIWQLIKHGIDNLVK